MRYEADGNPPDSDFVCVLCETYEVEANWLLFGNGPMKLEPHQKETHLDMFQDVFLGDKEAANRRALKMDDSGVVLRQSRQEAEELASKMITTLGLDESKSEYLRQTLQTTICQRLLAERQRDQAWEKVTTTPAPISDDNLGFGECAELLNKMPSAEFILRKVGDINKLQMIQSSGVKAITLDADIFDATLDAMERQTVSSKLSGSLMDELKALVLKDYGQEELDRAENLTAKIVITYDKRKKKAVLGREALESIAAKIVDEEDDNGFMIKTLSGETIRGSQIAVRTSVPLPKHGKSVWRDAAWDALNTYYLQLRENNTLEE